MIAFSILAVIATAEYCVDGGTWRQGRLGESCAQVCDDFGGYCADWDPILRHCTAGDDSEDSINSIQYKLEDLAMGEALSCTKSRAMAHVQAPYVKANGLCVFPLTRDTIRNYQCQHSNANRKPLCHCIDYGTGYADTFTRRVDGGLIKNFGPYPGNELTYHPTGYVAITPAGAYHVKLEWNLVGLDGRCAEECTAANCCGVHFHSGGSCENAGDVGGHYWNEDQMSDPWGPVRYYSNEDGYSNGQYAINFGFHLTSARGRTFVIHDFTGARIACGIFRYRTSL